MSNPYLTSESQLLFSKTFHDFAAPLGALALCIDDIKKALPDSGDLIEISVNTLFHKISYWRLMLTGSEQSPSYSDAANVIRPMAKLKSIEVSIQPSEDYRGLYVRLILGLVLLAVESLPRGGKIMIDADNGTVKASGDKCFLTRELQEVFDSKVVIPNSRHSLGLLIAAWAKTCNASLKYDHSSTSLTFTLKG